MKLENNYFDLKMQKALRKEANGANMTIVYLKLQLRSLANNGIINFEGLYPTLAEELAVDIDEALVDVQMTLAFLEKYGVIKQLKEGEFLIEEMQHRVGSITDSAMRMAKLRDKNKQNLMINNGAQSDANVTQSEGAQSDAILELDIEQDNNIYNKDVGDPSKILKNIFDFYNYQIRGEDKALIEEIISTYLNFADDCCNGSQNEIPFSNTVYKIDDIIKVTKHFDGVTISKIVNRLKAYKDRIQDRKHYIIATVLGVVLNSNAEQKR
jgi:predicted phage replisome organizer